MAYDEAVEKARIALANEGFGILSEINVTETIRQKLEKDFRKYLIIGTCNPQIAYKAFTVETEIGLLMPCNLIVYENDEGGCTVSAVDPVIAMSMIENPALALIAKEVRERMEKIITSLN
ncbi:MAG: DUF302 domain-containing protein [Deltaproteobacteria bacterium]|nr:DUF302 domain-containing protein [Deltaproteobacteria bacterium]